MSKNIIPSIKPTDRIFIANRNRIELKVISNPGEKDFASPIKINVAIGEAIMFIMNTG